MPYSIQAVRDPGFNNSVVHVIWRFKPLIGNGSLQIMTNKLTGGKSRLITEAAKMKEQINNSIL
jgi:hypothetical protein